MNLEAIRNISGIISTGAESGFQKPAKKYGGNFFWGCCFCAEMRRNIPEVVNDESNLLGKCFRGRRVGISDTKKERKLQQHT